MSISDIVTLVFILISGFNLVLLNIRIKKAEDELNVLKGFLIVIDAASKKDVPESTYEVIRRKH